MSAPSSAGICSACGKYAEKRYGGEGRFLPECVDCWTNEWIVEPARIKLAGTARVTIRRKRRT